MNKLQGVILPLATPVLEHGRLDRATLARLIEFELAAGVDAIFANGSMGGFAFHTDAQQALLIEAVVEIVNGRVPVLAGVSDTSVVRVLEKTERVRHLPLRAVVALPPYFLRYSASDLDGFFREIASESCFPLVIYDNPKQVANCLDVATIASLAMHPNVHGIKHSGDDEPFWRSLLGAPLPRGRFSLICGAETKMADGLQAGFDGITGGFHNVVPQLAVELMDAARAAEWGRAHVIQAEINALYPAFVRRGGFRGLNEHMSRLGVGGKYTPSFLHQEVPQ
ncbi:MAG: dihydrodipicolinate synthase family protein [Bryobacteraceae bacterium]|nr:dihydrodipicolinate synthase family protein [Bryobacteraceae bacterium]